MAHLLNSSLEHRQNVDKNFYLHECPLEFCLTIASDLTLMKQIKSNFSTANNRYFRSNCHCIRHSPDCSIRGLLLPLSDQSYQRTRKIGASDMMRITFAFAEMKSGKIVFPTKIR